MASRTSPRALLSPAALHILLSLAEGDRHGYGIKQEVEARTGGDLRIGPGTLYEAIHRMLEAGWIEESPAAVAPRGRQARRRVYRLTAAGRGQMESELARLCEIVSHAETRGLLPRARTAR